MSHSSWQSFQNSARETLSRHPKSSLPDRSGTEVHFNFQPMKPESSKDPQYYTNLCGSVDLGKGSSSNLGNTREETELWHAYRQAKDRFGEVHPDWSIITCKKGVADLEKEFEALLQQEVDLRGTGTVVKAKPSAEIEATDQASREKSCHCPTHFTGKKASEYLNHMGWVPVSSVEGDVVETRLFCSSRALGRNVKLPSYMVKAINGTLESVNDLVSKASTNQHPFALCRFRHIPGPFSYCRAKDLDPGSTRPMDKIYIKRPETAASTATPKSSGSTQSPWAHWGPVTVTGVETEVEVGVRNQLDMEETK